MSTTGAILLIFSMIHAYVFAVLLAIKKHSAKIFLSIYLINICLEYFLLLNNKVFKMDPVNYWFLILTPLITLTSLPSIYFYVKKLTQENFQFKWISCLHFLPGLILLVSTILVLANLEGETKINLNDPSMNNVGEMLPLILIYGISILIMLVQVILYSILMLILLFKHDKNLENVYSSKDEKSLKWLKTFVILYLIYCLYEVSVLLLYGVAANETIYYSIISLHVFLVGVLGYRQKDIYLSIVDTYTQDDIKKIENDELSKTSKRPMGLSDEVYQETIEKLETLIIIEKKFLDPELSLYDLSNELNINRSYLSFIINNHYNTNFYNFINTYRIDEAKKMLLNDQFNHLSVEGIAQSVGFKSRNVFYPVFKKIVGVTPAEFKQSRNLN